MQRVRFSDCGKQLFSASHESLKVWLLENEKDSALADNVESSWRGVLDLGYSQQDDFVYGVCQSSSAFSLYGTPLSQISSSAKVLPSLSAQNFQSVQRKNLQKKRLSETN